MSVENLLKTKIDIVEYIGRFTELRPKGSLYEGRCPIHGSDEGTPLVIYPQTNSYYCFACESGGDIIQFVSDYDNISRTMAIKKLAQEANINIDADEDWRKAVKVEDTHRAIIDKAKGQLDKVIDYLHKRGFTDETIASFELGFDNDTLVIPIRNEYGQPVAIARRQFDKSPKYINSRNNIMYDKSALLYNLDQAIKIKNKDELYMVEGYMDAISGHQMGLATVAYCGNEVHKDQLRTLTRALRKIPTIIYCPDNDAEGIKRVPRVRDYFREILPRVAVRVLQLPEGIKDFNDALKAGLDVSTLPKIHIDKYVLWLMLDNCKSEDDEYDVAHDFLKTVSNPLFKADIIKKLCERWNREFAELKDFFDSYQEDTDELVQEASTTTEAISDLKNLYMRGEYKTHFQNLDKCIGGMVKSQVMIVGAYSSSGKALTLDTDIITPNGKVKMGDIKVGDTVIGEDGLPTNVVAVFPQGEKDVYRVTFKDNTYVDCCEDHLWKFKTIDDLHRGYDWKVKSLKEIMANYKIRKGSANEQGYNLYIPVAKPVQYKEKEHVITPYVMGLLLGDGGFSSKQITFTNTEDDIISRLKQETVKYGEWKQNRIQYRFNKGIGDNPFTSYIYDTFGRVTGDKKFIPVEYIIDSYENRLMLVQGMLDADGNIDKSGFISFSSCNKRLASEFADVIRSLGARCTEVECNHVDKSMEYVVRVLEKSDKWFTSKKHKERYGHKRQVTRETNRKQELAIISIEKLGYKKPMQCITVDNSDHMYLCGDYIPTHNTDWLIEYLLRQVIKNKARTVFFSLEMSKGKVMERIIAKILRIRLADVRELVMNGDERIAQVEAKLSERLVIYDNNNLNIDEIEHRIVALNRKNTLGGPVDIVAVDYFTYLKGASTYEGASEQALKMKGLAKKYNVILVMLSQLNRGANTYNEPTMDLLRMTGDIEASGDVIIMLWRPEKEPGLSLQKQEELKNITRMKVEKARDGIYGPIRMELKYNNNTSLLEEQFD